MIKHKIIDPKTLGDDFRYFPNQRRPRRPAVLTQCPNCGRLAVTSVTNYKCLKCPTKYDVDACAFSNTWHGPVNKDDIRYRYFLPAVFRDMIIYFASDVELQTFERYARPLLSSYSSGGLPYHKAIGYTKVRDYLACFYPRLNLQVLK